MKLLKNFYKFEILDSTQDKAFELLKNHNEVVVISEKMLKGRGRYGNTWISDIGGLYMSIGFKDKNLDFSKKLLIISPVCIVELLKEYSINAYIKIPNDIYYYDKKLCGILVEIKDNDIVLGIGLNVNQNSFPSEINATSIFLISKRIYNIDEIAVKIYSAIKNLINYDFEEVVKVYNQYLLLKRYAFEYEGKYYEGNLYGIDKNHKAVFDIGKFDMFHIRNLRQLE
ncbi:MAG: biotin--[acetyl-CoA-carboxylase] ligase [candidate division WOR-3 bacterium]|nr:biotin--[acetyl-CoA-carboxylase] ligase [candidate division WOR-3 bacterium]MDW8150925.1 biotin--[acetyl-CoA-carboxylase] ligase [candidate division WOR-3 bacterium]